MPVAMPSPAVLIVESGLTISDHDTLCIPSTAFTWNAVLSWLKLVTMYMSLDTLSGFSRCITSAKSIMEIISSLGINIPSILGSAFGIGVGVWYEIISRILATLIP